MKIPRSGSVKRAEEVLYLVERELLNRLGKGFTVKDIERLTLMMSVNGREQGYVIRVWSHGAPRRTGSTIIFAENRNSDEVVVYYAYDATPLGDGNAPTQTMYETRKYFSTPGRIDRVAENDATLAAADHIVKLIEQSLKE